MALKLDKQQIAIRERTLQQILDLSLAVMRAHARPLLVATFLGAAPFILLNWYLLGDILDEDDVIPVWYFFLLSVLTTIELPIATAPATLYMGQSVFCEKPSARDLFRDLVRSLPQLILLQVLPRCVLVIIPLLRWPYLSEVILLERNPLRGSANRQSTWQRSRNLHKYNLGDLFVRWFGAVLVGVMLILLVWLSLWSLTGQIFGYWFSYDANFGLLLPIGAWLVMGYFTVVRFLCYLDLRIRREGWEVELVLRAEAARLASQPG